MGERSVPLVSIASGASGAVATALALFVTHQNLTRPPPPNNVDNAGLAVLLIFPLAILGGVLVAHGVYRFVPSDVRTPWSLVVYPLASAGAITLVAAYIAFLAEYVSLGSLLELVVPALVAGGIAGGFVWFIDRVRDSLLPDDG